jgi:hypothetical protein
MRGDIQGRQDVTRGFGEKKNEGVGQCWLVWFQMKSSATMICRVTILTYVSVSNIIAVTTNGEYCFLQSLSSDVSNFH